MHNTNSTQPTPEAAQQPRPTAQKAEIIDETVQKLHLDEATAAAVRQILEPVEHGVSGSLVTLVAKALKHDDDVKNADAAGYLRVRNEKIEVLTTPDSAGAETTPVNFPRYVKRSFWDDVDS